MEGIINPAEDEHFQNIVVKEELLHDEDKGGYSFEETEYKDCYSNEESEKVSLVSTHNLYDKLFEDIVIKEEVPQEDVKEVECLLSNTMYSSSYDPTTEKLIPKEDQNSFQPNEDLGFPYIFYGERSMARKNESSDPLRKRLKCTASERIHYRADEANMMLPADVFGIFFNDDLVNLIVLATNESWSWSTGLQSKLVTRRCVEKFFGILMLSELNCQPNFSDYWSKYEIYGNALVTKAMSYKTFCHIMEHLSFTIFFDDDECHNLSELQPLINSLSQSFKLYTPGEKVVFSERIIDIEEESSQYEYRLFKMCSFEGYTWSFKIDIGKKGPLTSRLGTVERIIISLLDGLLMEARILYVQNYATFNLAKSLLEKNTYVCGSLKANPGDAHAREALLTSISNDGNANGTTIRQCEIDFNRAKTGATLSDQRMRVAVPLLKCQQWHVRVACELLLGSAVNNAFILYNKYHSREKLLDEIPFRESLIVALLKPSVSSKGKDERDVIEDCNSSQGVS